ncbi:acyl carrier protein [Sodiomyces alkalinus F11]|uniref:Acyl carrier protein n=1 Tax=Sodiomyces alkalinus (strain CBS 110278 / VKM F-3762 / F11) TaxID=1314773 RepID=A0A3N2PTE0_SODAK|nr:acyl carrier protein [Sodiomyces alkalinus F11]ROT37785.1 acyl carrier protein [Sodiomyces alkalinus F11]
MFRSAVLRTASAAARVARPSVALRAPLARQPVLAASAPRLVAAWKPLGVRMYSAGGALTKNEVETRITTLLNGFDKVNDPKNITSSAHFANDLGLDSLDAVEVVMAIEEEFSIEIPDKDADTIHSVNQAVEYILSQPDAQ